MWDYGAENLEAMDNSCFVSPDFLFCGKRFLEGKFIEWIEEVQWMDTMMEQNEMDCWKPVVAVPKKAFATEKSEIKLQIT